MRKGGTILLSQIFNILAETPSQPLALFGLRFRIRLSIFSGINFMFLYDNW